MMKAEVGAICVVTGRSSAMVSAGPMPGSTPMAVPSAEPTKAQTRLHRLQRDAEAVEEGAERVHV